jgi:hypothetical protein
VTRRARGRHGQALVEMVLVLPVLLLIVFGIIEMANAWRTYQVVTNVAREGGRQAILPSADSADVHQEMLDGLEANGLGGAVAFEIECDDGATAFASCSTGQETHIRISYPYTFRTLGPVAAWACGAGCASSFGSITIASTTVMRKE